MKKLLLLLLVVSCSSVNDSVTNGSVKTTGDAVLDTEIADAIKQMSESITGMDQWADITLPTKSTEKTADYYFFDADSFKWLSVDIFDGTHSIEGNNITFNNEVVEKEVKEGNLTIRSVAGLTITSEDNSITSEEIKSFDKLYTLETTFEKEWLTPKLDGSGKWDNIIESNKDQYTTYHIVKKTDSTISIILVFKEAQANTYIIRPIDKAQTFLKQ